MTTAHKPNFETISGDSYYVPEAQMDEIAIYREAYILGDERRMMLFEECCTGWILIDGDEI